MRKYISIWLTVALVAVAGSAYGQSGLVPPNTVQAGPPSGVSKGFMRPRALVPNDLPATTVTGGTTARKDKDRWADNFIEAPDIGVDCTNTNDSTTAIQNFFTANPNGHLRFPVACNFFTSSTIVVSDGNGTVFDGETFRGGGDGLPTWNWKGTNGGTACAQTASQFANCVFMLDFEHSDHPTVQNLAFRATSPNCPDGMLKFDGDFGAFHVGTNARIIGNAFSNTNCLNPNFVGVSIAFVATGNHENYVLRDNQVGCSGSHITYAAKDGVTNGTTTLTSASNPFTVGMIGQRVRLSFDNNTAPHAPPYSRGYFDTTITGFTNSGTVTLAAAVPFTASPVVVVVGQGYGIGYRNGPSQNALQQTFATLQTSWCQVGVLVAGGGVQVTQLNGGTDDVGAYFDGFIAQNSTIDYYADESDYIAIAQRPGSGAPFEISNARFSNGNQAGNGFLQLGGTAGTTIRNSLVAFGVPNTNSVLIGPYLGVGVGALGTITGGSGYVPGTYTNVPLGTINASTPYAATATVVVGGGGAVTSVTLTNQGFIPITAVPGVSMTTANTNLGGSGSGFSVPVLSLVAPKATSGDVFPRLTSINNNWQQGFGATPITWARLGLDQMADPPMIEIGDQIADTPDNLSGNNHLPCARGAASCVLVDALLDQTGHGQSQGAGVQVNMGSSIIASGAQTAFRATGQPSISGNVLRPGGGTSYTAFQAYPETLASGGTTQTLFDAAWGALNPLPLGTGPYYGFRAESPVVSGGGTLALMYGFECDKQKTGSQITRAWCFYNADAADFNFFAGPTMLGNNTLTVPAGGLGLAKIAADGVAPGAAGGKIELVCGTAAGSAKLIAYAGTSTTPVTILDNIGSGVTGC